MFFLREMQPPESHMVFCQQGRNREIKPGFKINLIKMQRFICYIYIITMLPVSIAFGQGTTAERVTIKNGKELIDGVLVVPAKARQAVPAMIFLGGSGQWEIVDSYLKDPSTSYANFLSFYLEGYIRRNQVAFLYLNKRGFGRSTGKYGKTSLEGRASDANAAFEFLQNHPGIDREKIGMIGHSQGGWVAMLAASKNERVAFVISFAGPTVGVKHQTLTDYKNQFDCQYGKGSKSNRKFRRKKMELWAGSVIGKLIGGSAGEYARMVKYDPKQALLNIRMPCLLLFGEKDLIVPPDENVQYFKKIFHGDVPGVFTCFVGRKLNHAFHEVDNGCVGYMESLKKPESRELQLFLQGWIEMHVMR